MDPFTLSVFMQARPSAARLVISKKVLCNFTWAVHAPSATETPAVKLSQALNLNLRRPRRNKMGNKNDNPGTQGL